MNDDIPVAGNHLVSLDDLMPEQESAEPSASTEVALLAIDPADYINLAFGDLNTEAQAIIENLGMTVYDTDTPLGMELAKRDESAFVDLRLAMEKLHQRYKHPVLDLGRMLDSAKKDFLAKIAPYEQHYKQSIKAAKDRAAAAQEALLEAERQRVADIEERIAALYALPGQALNQRAANVETMLIAAEAVIIDDSYGEYRAKAQMTKDFAVETLRTALASKREAEENQAELERLRAQTAVASPAPAAPPARKGNGRTVRKPFALAPLDALLLTYNYLTGQVIERDELLQVVALTLQAEGVTLPPPPHQP